MMAKMTMPANMEVAQFVKATMRASRVQLLLIGLYDEYAIRPPKARPRGGLISRVQWITICLTHLQIWSILMESYVGYGLESDVN